MYNVGDSPLAEYYAKLAQAKSTAETAKATEVSTSDKANQLSESIMNQTSNGGEARKAANNAMTAMQTSYQAYNNTLAPYEAATRALNQLLSQNPPATDSQIAAAKAAVENAQTIRENAYNAYLKAQEDWKEKDEAADKAEGEDSVELENAINAHNDAVQACKDADDAVVQAETELNNAKYDLIEEGYQISEDGTITGVPETDEADEAKEATEASGADEANAVSGSEPLMTEDEAIAQGYTVIKSYEDLLAIGNDLGGKYILMGNIDIPDGVNWTPIGDANSPFTGEFNGNGFNINNLNIAVTEDDVENIGFFGVTEGAKISNVNIVDAKINGKTDTLSGTTNAGILVGLARATTFDNITVSGEVNAYAAAGGMIGAIDDSGFKAAGLTKNNTSISNCHANGNVYGQYYAGGLVGYIYGTERILEGTDDVRDEDHRGIVTKSLIISNCTTSGTATAGEESVGGLIGESGKTLITLENCSSDMDLYWTNIEDDSAISFLLETGRIGGLIGNIDGSYITIANCEFNGSLNGDTEFQSEVYGWYMDDAHVAIWDIPGGLPVDDILKIDGIDGMRAIGNGKYECTVSTLSGLDKMVAMIKENPGLADIVVWQINFDFKAMDGAYDYSDYAQYGIIQHLYEDEDGNVHNDVYIDNECDLESTYHRNFATPQVLQQCDPVPGDEGGLKLYPTMIPGLYKNDEEAPDSYWILDELGVPHQVYIESHGENQITDIEKRLTTSEVKFREALVNMGWSYQRQMRDILKRMFNYEGDQVPIISKAEYKKLCAKAEKYGMNSLTDKEKLSMAVFEVDYDIMNAQALVTRNLGCGMGGNASFLDKTTTHQMYDEDGNALFTTLDGTTLLGVYDDDGKLTGYQYPDGKAYDGEPEGVYEQRGYQKTDEDGNLLFSSKAEDGSSQTVTQIKGEDGSVSYVTTDADGNQIPFEGDVNSLERQLEPCNYGDDYAGFEESLLQILKDVEDGKYPKGSGNKSSGSGNIFGTDADEIFGDTNGDGVVDEKDEIIE